MPYDFSLTTQLPATPDQVYRAWLSSEEHEAMTGGAAQIDPRPGGAFTAWDGYIEGVTLLLEPGRRIVQRWRTSEFDPDDADSQIEVLLEPSDEGTSLTLHHTQIPDGQSGYEQGWVDSYFDPMREYFGSR